MKYNNQISDVEFRQAEEGLERIVVNIESDFSQRIDVFRTYFTKTKELYEGIENDLNRLEDEKNDMLNKIISAYKKNVDKRLLNSFLG